MAAATPATLLAQGAENPVQVYIMMGQSNMLGFGGVTGGTEGKLDYAVDTKGLYPYLRDGAAWATRNDVRNVRVQGSGGAAPGSTGSVIRNDWLTVNGHNNIGVEFGIGHHLGEALDAPVMLLKSAIGNRALGWDLLPPGGVQYDHADGYTYPGSGGSPERWLTGTTPEPIGWYAGLQYEGDVTRAHSVLDNLGTYYPGATDYEVAGFFWWQGDRDRYKDGHADRYEQNLVRLIDEVRLEFNAPNANFVLATLGQTEMGDTGNDGTILDAQLAVDGDAGNYPQFAGNVKTVYSNPLSLGGASNSHYNGHAETYMNVGQAMGEAMAMLIADDPNEQSYLEINQQTGEIRIINPAGNVASFDLEGYQISSPSGALDPTAWIPIAGNYDGSGNGSVDTGNWTVGSSTAALLGESADAGGNDGSIGIGNQVTLGVGAWIQNLTKDLSATYTDIDGNVRTLDILYAGNENIAADLNFDGSIDITDWGLFITNAHADLSALTGPQAYQLGDLDNDLDNDLDDFILFRSQFEAMNPQPGAFQAMFAAYYAVPEPSSILLLAIGAMGLAMRRRRSDSEKHNPQWGRS